MLLWIARLTRLGNVFFGYRWGVRYHNDHKGVSQQESTFLPKVTNIQLMGAGENLISYGQLMAKGVLREPTQDIPEMLSTEKGDVAKERNYTARCVPLSDSRLDITSAPETLNTLADLPKDDRKDCSRIVCLYPGFP